MKKYELKPCPFCGSKKVDIDDSVYHITFVECLNCNAQTKEFFIPRDDWTRETMKEKIKEAVKAWNTRTAAVEKFEPKDNTEIERS